MKSHPSLRARHSTATRSRRGAVLILFAMLVFLFLAMASVAIDVGMASLTQQQMQVAVDPAALEGVRLRDFDEYQFLSNQHRRPKVSNLVRLVFDDDLKPTGGTPGLHGGYLVPPDDPDALQLGAGPMMHFTGGDSSTYAASSTIVVPDEKVLDDPVLQENQGNDRAGDMVSGTYVPGSVHVEDSSYVRSDFAEGATSQASTKAIGFLVRMRRTTTGSNVLDAQTGVSSSGPSLPLLFGMGSLMHQDPSSAWDPRRDGLNVRSTAIAVGRPALRASMPPRRADGTVIYDEGAFGTNAMLGLYPIAISQAEWCNTILAGTWNHPQFSFDVQSDGRLLRDTTGVLTGRFVAPATSVGLPLTPTGQTPIDTNVQSRGYIAIYAPIATPSGGFVDRVIGYGFAQVNLASNGTVLNLKPGYLASTSDVTVWVGPNGVSAHLDASAPALSKAEWDAVFAANHNLAYGGAQNPGGAVTYDSARVRPGTLLAPALAR